MINLLVLAVAKIFDNIINTAKSISTYKGQKLLSSILVTLSQITFYLIVSKVTKGNNMLLILDVSIASGIGNYIAFEISNKFEKDKMWTNILTCRNMDEMKKFCEQLKEQDIEYIVNLSLDRHWENTYSILVFPQTKQQSKFIDKYIKNTPIKYLRKILKEK